MKSRKTASVAPVTEHQKALARLVLLTVVGLVCPPLAAAKSGLVWGIYLLLVVLYSLWTVHVTTSSPRDARLGYLLTAADGAILVPVMVWSLGAAIPVVLSLLWAVGAGVTWRAAHVRHAAPATSSAHRRSRTSSRAGLRGDHADRDADGAPLERALRVRLRVLREDGTRFALVVLRLEGYEAMIVDAGKEATKGFLHEMGQRSLRLLGDGAQLFPLPGGRLAFVFATEPEAHNEATAKNAQLDGIDPTDVESMAMALATKTCEKTLGGHRLECVVGWASAPADGTDVDDLMYAAESGALSTAAFRRVGGSRVAVPEADKKRAIAS